MQNLRNGSNLEVYTVDVKGDWSREPNRTAEYRVEWTMDLQRQTMGSVTINSIIQLIWFNQHILFSGTLGGSELIAFFKLATTDLNDQRSLRDDCFVLGKSTGKTSSRKRGKWLDLLENFFLQMEHPGRVVVGDQLSSSLGYHESDSAAASKCRVYMGSPFPFQYPYRSIL
uniref:Uncharacterized protein n=1 Tax=Trichuris muris TaxID=70415 RepID=A0A5S6R4U0_TRIMR